MPADHVLKYVEKCVRVAMESIAYEKKHLSIEKRFLNAKWEGKKYKLKNWK